MTKQKHKNTPMLGSPGTGILKADPKASECQMAHPKRGPVLNDPKGEWFDINEHQPQWYHPVNLKTSTIGRLDNWARVTDDAVIYYVECSTDGSKVIFEDEVISWQPHTGDPVFHDPLILKDRQHPEAIYTKQDIRDIIKRLQNIRFPDNTELRLDHEEIGYNRGLNRAIKILRKKFI